jgi:RHS repeat-associated protein
VGNLLKDGRASYTYDAFNRQTKAEMFDGNIQTNRYDPEGLRYEMEENERLVQFIFRDKEVIAEESKAGMVRYIRTHELLASDAESARTYYHYASDELGSITHVTEGEEVLNRYGYDAWGDIVAKEEAVENRFCFAGEQYDSVSQQYYLRARFYNPVIGRFTQEDTYRGDGLNLYAYCRNNPVYYVDPSGHSLICAKRAKEIIDKIKQGNVSDREVKKLSAYLNEKIANKEGLGPEEQSIAQKLGIDNKNSDTCTNKITRRQEFRRAKESIDIPKSAQYNKHGFVYDGSTENRIVYEFDVDGGKKYIVEHPFDKRGRGDHFHGANASLGSPFNKGKYYQYDGHFPEDFAGFK